MVIIPITIGIITEKSNAPRPAVMGSYKPRQIKIEDELSPGTIRLNPKRTPHSKNPKNDGAMTVLPPFSIRWKKRYAQDIDTIKGVQLLLGSLCSETLKSFGSVPQIKPKNSINATDAYAEKNNSTPFASKINPKNQPKINGINSL